MVDSNNPVEDDPPTIALAHKLDDEKKKRTADVLDSSTQQNNASSFINMRFTDLSLCPAVLRGLEDAGFSRPSPVQVRAIPLGRMGLDLIVQAKSGTGKTVVFVVIILEAIDVSRPALQALVLSPTREIALQSQLVFERLGAHIPGLKCQLFVGGLPLADDIRNLQNCHIAVGTPGRVRYLIETGYMCVDQLRHLVLDEADLLLAGGADAKLTGGSANNAFPADVNSIWWSLPETKQVMALSATYSDYLIEQHLHRYMNDPATVRLASYDPALVGVRQFFTIVSSADRSPATVFAAKVARLCKLLSEVEFQQCLIFSNFHSSAQDLCHALHSRGWPVTYISSSLDQGERFRAYNRLRAFHCRVLVSTDLTSRGIDAENVNLVVSLEVPWEHPTYLHRVGRAGRFGSYGASVLVVADMPDEQRLLHRLQSSCPTKIVELPDPAPADLAAPDCPIDLDSLVTVTNHPDSTRIRPEPRRQTKKGCQKRTPRVQPRSLEEEDTSPQPAIEAVTMHSQQWSQLPQKMTEYLSAVWNKPEGPCMKDYTSWLDSIEARLLEDLDSYYQADMPDLVETIPSAHPPANRPNKEPPKYTTDAVHTESVSVQQADQTATELKPQNEWTAEKVVAWNQYCQLTHMSQCYYHAWVSALEEYNAAVNKLSSAMSRVSTD